MLITKKIAAVVSLSVSLLAILILSTGVAEYALASLSLDGAEPLQAKALILLLVSILLVASMYAYDAARSKTGALSYWDFGKIKDAPPYNTILFYSLFFCGFVISSFILIVLRQTLGISDFDLFVVRRIAEISIVSTVLLLIQSNNFDAIAANSKGMLRTNVVRIRKMAWYLHLWTLYGLLLVLFLVLIFISPVVAFVANTLMLFVIFLIYFGNAPYSIEREGNEENLRDYFLLSEKHLGYGKDQYDDKSVTFVYREKDRSHDGNGRIYGGVRVIYPASSKEHRLPLEHSGFSLRESQLAFDPQGSSYCELSRLVLHPGKRNVVYGNEQLFVRLFGAGYCHARSHGVDYILIAAAKAQAKLYERYRFHFEFLLELPYEPYMKRKKKADPMGLYCIDLSDRSIVEDLDSRFNTSL